MRVLEDAPLGGLLLAVSKLSLLTKLRWDGVSRAYADAAVDVPLPASAFTLLTASTNLCSLTLQSWWQCAPYGMALFGPGTLYPQLRSITLHDAFRGVFTADSQQQLEYLCSCCPALESLSFALWQQPSHTALAPLRQLSALTYLSVHASGVSPAALPAAMGSAAQLTTLKLLSFSGLNDLTGPTLLQLTALTALEQLSVSTLAAFPRNFDVHLQNKARRCNPPDVWIQLLRHLLMRDAACRQALLESSSGAAAAPAELMLAQLAASLACDAAALAEELAEHRLGQQQA